MKVVRHTNKINLWKTEESIFGSPHLGGRMRPPLRELFPKDTDTACLEWAAYRELWLEARECHRDRERRG